MNFSPQWNERYRENTHLSLWPWTDVVVYVMRYARLINSSFRVLEMGCGAGANIPFFLKLGVDYHAMDGSDFIVDKLRKNYPTLAQKLRIGDFTREIPFEGQFDLILDRGSITNNTTQAIRSCFSLIKERLSDTGLFIGIDWFSTEHSEFKKGDFLDDTTKKDIKDGPYANLGNVHFADQNHMMELLAPFNIKLLEYKSHKRLIPEEDYHIATWNFIVSKK